MKATDLLITAISVMVLAAGCGGPKTSAEVDRDVAGARKEAASDVADARDDAARKVASAETDARKEMQMANQQTEVAQADLAKVTAEANYKVSMERAEGEHHIAIEKCEALSGDVRKTCRDAAAAAMAVEKVRADEARATTLRGSL